MFRYNGEEYDDGISIADGCLSMHMCSQQQLVLLMMMKGSRRITKLSMPISCFAFVLFKYENAAVTVQIEAVNVRL